MKKQNTDNYNDFRDELGLKKAKTPEEIEKIAFDEKVTGSELVSALYDDVAK